MSKARKVPNEDRASKRCHYNKHRKAKMAFGCEDDAWAYIEEKRLYGYMAYLCKECNKWHIGRLVVKFPRIQEKIERYEEMFSAYIAEKGDSDCNPAES